LNFDFHYPIISQMKKYLNISILNIGFTAGMAQILFLRELLSLFQGNEITIGIVFTIWLFWTAAGSFLTGRLLTNRINTNHLVVPVILIVALVLPLSIFFLRFMVGFMNSVPGIAAGLDQIFLVTFLALAVFCFVSGSSFAVLSSNLKNLQKGSIATATGKLYALESFGAAIAGIMLSFFLLDYFDSLTIAILTAAVQGFTGIFLILKFSLLRPRLLFLFSLLLLFFAAIASVSSFSDHSLQYHWKHLKLVGSYESHFGKLSLVEAESGKSLYSNDAPLFTIPDPESAEESVHFALLQHPNPENVLIIGNGFSGTIIEILKHPIVKRIDYVEQDPKIIEIAKQYFPEMYNKLSSNSAVHFHIMDGRKFLEVTPLRFDVIILNMAEPNSIQNNRFFTSEFYTHASLKLSDTGILTFKVNGSENFISDELASYLSCLYATLKSAFSNTSVYPGETIHFFGCNSQGLLTDDTDLLIDRIKERKLNLQYLREYYLPFRLSSERIEYLLDKIKPSSHTPVNKDFEPVACYFNLNFWNHQHNDFSGKIFRKLFETDNLVVVLIIAAILFALLALFWFSHSRQLTSPFIASTSVLISGFSLLGIEGLALLIFQVQQGYLFQQIAILIGCFMAGMGTGSMIFIKYKDRFMPNPYLVLKSLFLAHGILFIIPLILVTVFQTENISALDEHLSTFIFTLILFLTGISGGLIFPLAGQIYYQTFSQNTGFLYAIDLIGAMAGAVIVNVLIVPTAGFYRAALVVSILQISVFCLLAWKIIGSKNAA
jgi:spermidine synthase